MMNGSTVDENGHRLSAVYPSDLWVLSCAAEWGKRVDDVKKMTKPSTLLNRWHKSRLEAVYEKAHPAIPLPENWFEQVMGAPYHYFLHCANATIKNGETLSLVDTAICVKIIVQNHFFSHNVVTEDQVENNFAKHLGEIVARFSLVSDSADVSMLENSPRVNKLKGVTPKQKKAKPLDPHEQQVHTLMEKMGSSNYIQPQYAQKRAKSNDTIEPYQFDSVNDKAILDIPPDIPQYFENRILETLQVQERELTDQRVMIILESKKFLDYNRLENAAKRATMCIREITFRPSEGTNSKLAVEFFTIKESKRGKKHTHSNKTEFISIDKLASQRLLPVVKSVLTRATRNSASPCTFCPDERWYLESLLSADITAVAHCPENEPYFRALSSNGLVFLYDYGDMSIAAENPDRTFDLVTTGKLTHEFCNAFHAKKALDDWHFYAIESFHFAREGEEEDE